MKIKRTNEVNTSFKPYKIEIFVESAVDEDILTVLIQGPGYPARFLRTKEDVEALRKQLSTRINKDILF